MGEDLTALTETTVSIACLVSGIPRPRVTWYKDNNVIESGERVTLDGPNLVIRNASLAENGRYVCKAKNLMGEASRGSNVLFIGE